MLFNIAITLESIILNCSWLLYILLFSILLFILKPLNKPGNIWLLLHAGPVYDNINRFYSILLHSFNYILQVFIYGYFCIWGNNPMQSHTDPNIENENLIFIEWMHNLDGLLLKFIFVFSSTQLSRTMLFNVNLFSLKISLNYLQLWHSLGNSHQQFIYIYLNKFEHII